MLFTKKKDVVGVDIGTTSIKVVQLKGQKGAFQLQNVGIIPLPPEAIVDNSLMDTSSIVEAVKNILKSLDLKGVDVACSISGNSVIIRKISLPAMPPEELEEQLQWEAEQYIPFDINDVNIDFQILSPDENDPSKMSLLLVASKKDIINDYVAVFNEAGLKLVVMDVDAFAVQNAYEINYDIAAADVVALVNIGASMMNLNIVREGTSLFTRDVQMGGNLYTEEIQKQLGVSGEEAERIKVSGNYPDSARLEEVMTRVSETVALEVRRSLDFYNSTAGEGKIGKIYLSGGGAKTQMLPSVVSQKLGVPVEVLNPLANIKYSDKDYDPDYLQAIGPLMTVAVGLATRRLGDK
jgi:type IV pilus assembly protein PilM